MHPFDRLGDIRTQVRALLQEAREIKFAILHGDIDGDGKRYTAQVFRRVVLTPIAQPEAKPHHPVPKPMPTPPPEFFDLNHQGLNQPSPLNAQQNYNAGGLGQGAFGMGRFGGSDD